MSSLLSNFQAKEFWKLDEKKEVKISMPESVIPVTEKNEVIFCPHCGEKLKKLTSGVSSYLCHKCGKWNIRKVSST